MMSARWTAVGIALLVLVAAGIAWWLLGRGGDGRPAATSADAPDGEHPKPPDALAPTLVGRPHDAADSGAARRSPSGSAGASSTDASAADATATERVTLVVREARRESVAGAKVSRFAKRSGANEQWIAIGDSDAAGRASIPISRTRASWVVVTKLGFVAAILDGDALAVGTDVVVELAEGGTIEVVVTEADDRTPIADVEVRADASREPHAYEPRADGPPSGRLGELTRVVQRTGDDGRAVIRVGTAGPVHVDVQPRNWNMYAEPSSVELPRAQGSVRFRVLPGCRLVIHAIDDASGQPLAVPFEVDRRAEGSDDAIGGSTTNPEKTGVFDLFPGLRPGRYLLRLRADGYAPWQSDPILLDRPGASAVIDARMKSAPWEQRRGSLRVTLGKPPKEGAAWYERGGVEERGPAVTMRRTDPEPTMWGRSMPHLSGTIGWMKVDPEHWDAASRVYEIRDLDAARYAIAVLDRSTWSVGGVADIEVLPDRATERQVDLVSGVRVRIADLAAGAPSVRGVRLFDEHGVEWPAVSLIHGGMTVYDVDAAIPAGVVLDPVPADRARVTWRSVDGADHEAWFPPK